MDNINRIFYINLDHRTDRKTEIETELNTHLTHSHYTEKVERFNAIKCSNGSTGAGAIGCSMSHLEILKLAKARNYKYIIVFEDDFQFLINKDELYTLVDQVFEQVFEQVFAQSLTPALDFKVIMLSYNALQRTSLANNDILDSTTNSQTTAGYLINCKYIDILIENYTQGIQLFNKTGEHWNYAIDQYWKKEQKDKWFIFKKRIGKQRAGYSDIGRQYSDNNC
jgi:glycosyl transferase family 25